MKKFINVILLVILLIMSVMNCILVRDLEQKTLELTEIYNTEPEIVFLDSIEFDTVYITKTDVVKLPIYNTDTIVEIDSVFVEVPINTYHYDTTLAETHINLICEGFDVRLNSLLIENLKMPTIEQKPLKRWYKDIHLGVGLGATYCNGFKILPTLGIYYTLFSF